MARCVRLALPYQPRRATDRCPDVCSASSSPGSRRHRSRRKPGSRISPSCTGGSVNDQAEEQEQPGLAATPHPEDPATCQRQAMDNGRDESGRRVEIPLGSDRIEALRKWAEFEAAPVPADASSMRAVFDRYERDIIPTKATRTQASNRLELARLRSVFDSAPIDAITPQHVAQYRDARTAAPRTLKDGTVIPAHRATVAANRELALLSHIINMAREWGYTARENPVRGVRKNREAPRSYYASPEVWAAVQACSGEDLRAAAYRQTQRLCCCLKSTGDSV